MIHAEPATGRRRGAAAVEFAMLLPLFLTLIMGIWEVGRVVQVQQVLLSAAREGGRQASTGLMTNAQVQQVVLNHLTNEGIQVTDAQNNPLPGVAVTVQDVTSPGQDASTANQLDYVTISVALPYTKVRWTTLTQFVDPTTQLYATVGWYSMKNSPLSVSQTIPGAPQ